MSEQILQDIQRLQFNERPRAEALLKDFLRETFPALDIQGVELRPQVISLNSFNGFLRLGDGGRLFFKTHTEEDTVIDEYYNARMLAEAGYPIIVPVHESTRAGQQILIYEVIEDPSVFDVAWQIEQGEGTERLEALTMAQNQADDLLLDYHLRSLQSQNAQDAARAPVHQLFYHRLAGGRLERFYGALPGTNKIQGSIQLPDAEVTLEKLRSVKWVINGQRYEVSLDELIQAAIELLKPEQGGPSVIGHGDAHNGNVFFRQNEQPARLLYFDPAFAGRHHPLLDLTKPLFHNVFAMWMYYPQVKREQTRISLKRYNGTFEVTHDYALPEIRQMFLRSKVDRTLIPVLQEIKKRGELRDDWRRYLKAALFCCPFLTLNLADSGRFPPEISLLGLTMAVEMGADSNDERSLIDQTLDNVARVLAIDTAPPSDRWYR